MPSVAFVIPKAVPVCCCSSGTLLTGWDSCCSLCHAHEGVKAAAHNRTRHTAHSQCGDCSAGGSCRAGKASALDCDQGPPARLPVLGPTESTCAYTWIMRGCLPGAAVMNARLLRASPPVSRPSKLTVRFMSPATPAPTCGSRCMQCKQHKRGAPRQVERHA
jgi:hypothetical protein